MCILEGHNFPTALCFPAFPTAAFKKEKVVQICEIIFEFIFGASYHKEV
jgi:hypothetical protein